MSSNCVFCDKSCDISVYATIHISNVDEHTLKYIARHALFSFVLSLHGKRNISLIGIFEKLFRLLVKKKNSTFLQIHLFKLLYHFDLIPPQMTAYQIFS